MSDIHTAIIGAGPAGSMAASLLARAGRDVLLIDGRGVWEKPCGGGVTPKALRRYRWMLETDHYPHTTIDKITLVAPSGRSVDVEFDEPFHIYSRSIFNQMLYDRALNAGAQFWKAKVESISRKNGGWTLNSRAGSVTCDYLVGADGANSLLRRTLFGRFADADLSATFGYRMPSAGRSTAVVEFLPSFSGYLWAFPRPDHVSFGIINKAGEFPGKKLRELVLNFVARLQDRIDWLEQGNLELLESEVIAGGTSAYGAIVPALRKTSIENLQVVGDGWALAGDAAGFVDPITGEGIYYSLRSAELLAASLIDGDASRYDRDWRADFSRELMTAAKYRRRFYWGEFFGRPVIEQTVRFTSRSPRLRYVLASLMTGEQHYQNLRSQLLRLLFRDPRQQKEQALRNEKGIQAAR